MESAITQPKFYTIDFDMMLKGSIYKRRKQTVRQFGVTVNGATRLVTSGDVVDSATYNALLAAGAVRLADERDVARDDARRAGNVQPDGSSRDAEEHEE